MVWNLFKPPRIYGYLFFSIDCRRPLWSQQKIQETCSYRGPSELRIEFHIASVQRINLRTDQERAAMENKLFLRIKTNMVSYFLFPTKRWKKSIIFLW